MSDNSSHETSKKISKQKLDSLREIADAVRRLAASLRRKRSTSLKRHRHHSNHELLLDSGWVYKWIEAIDKPIDLKKFDTFDELTDVDWI